KTMRVAGCLVCCLLVASSYELAHSDSAAPAARLLRPVALALTADGNWLYVANRNSASISVLDTRQQKLAGEFAIGRRLVDIVLAPDGQLLAVDEAAGALLVFSCRYAN